MEELRLGEAIQKKIKFITSKLEIKRKRLQQLIVRKIHLADKIQTQL